jgi:hypothetical protein
MPNLATPMGRALLSNLQGASSPVPVYDPVAALGSDGIAWWNPDRSDLITKDGSNLIGSYTDVIGGYTVTQATGSAKPTYASTGFNGFPGISTDGIDDTLAFMTALPAAIPIGATPCEIWAVVQNADQGSTTSRMVAGYGGATNGRALGRAIAGPKGLAQTEGSLVTGSTITLNLRHVLRSKVGATTTTLVVDNAETASATVTPATANNRLRLFSSWGFTAGEFWQGVVRDVFVTKPIAGTGKEVAFVNWIMNRRAL